MLDGNERGLQPMLLSAVPACGTDQRMNVSMGFSQKLGAHLPGETKSGFVLATYHWDFNLDLVAHTICYGF